MKIFLRSDDPAAVADWLACGVPDGLVLTASGAAGCLGRVLGDLPADFTVIAEADASGEPLAEFGGDAVVDLPIAGPHGGHGLAALHAGHVKGRTMSVRGCTAVGQVLLSWRAGVTYARLDWSGIVEDGGDPLRVVAGCAQWGGLRDVGQFLLIDALDTVGDFYDALRTSADGVIVSPQVLQALTRYAGRGSRS